MKEQWSNDGSAVKIYGDYSPHPVIVTKAVVEYFGGTESAYHGMQKLRQDGYTPRLNASESFPFSMLDAALALENKSRNTKRQNRYWKFGRFEKYTEYIQGYYHLSDDGNKAIFSGGTVWTL